MSPFSLVKVVDSLCLTWHCLKIYELSASFFVKFYLLRLLTQLLSSSLSNDCGKALENLCSMSCPVWRKKVYPHRHQAHGELWTAAQLLGNRLLSGSDLHYPPRRHQSYQKHSLLVQVGPLWFLHWHRIWNNHTAKNKVLDIWIWYEIISISTVIV